LLIRLIKKDVLADQGHQAVHNYIADEEDAEEEGYWLFHNRTNRFE
jgi:hypothetical protein